MSESEGKDNMREIKDIRTIEDIATNMRMLASEIGGNHHTNKESEEILNKLADMLSTSNIQIALTIDAMKNQVKENTGIRDEHLRLFLRQQNIKKNAEPQGRNE